MWLLGAGCFHLFFRLRFRAFSLIRLAILATHMDTILHVFFCDIAVSSALNRFVQLDAPWHCFYRASFWCPRSEIIQLLEIFRPLCGTRRCGCGRRGGPGSEHSPSPGAPNSSRAPPIAHSPPPPPPPRRAPPPRPARAPRRAARRGCRCAASWAGARAATRSAPWRSCRR